MAVTVTLSTVPATAAREKYGTTMSLDLFGPSLGAETLPAVFARPCDPKMALSEPRRRSACGCPWPS